MWTVKDGRLYLNGEPVGVRRALVEMVVRRRQGTVTEEQARTMIRMERAVSLQDLSASLAPGEAAP
jgi:hypothetical protein